MAKWHLLKSVILTTILSFSALTHATEEIDGMVEIQKITFDMLVDGLHEIENVSTDEEKAIINQIVVSVSQDGNPDRVLALKMPDGTRCIIVSTGYSTVTFMITFAYNMEAKLGIDNFGEEYARYVTENYAKNSITHVNQSAWDYANLSGSSSPWHDQELVAAVYGNHALALWYVLAHEVAHHVLGHLDTPSTSLAQNRKKEQEADDWASKTLIKLGIPPAVAYPSLMYWYFMDEYGVENEYQKTHPADLRRIRSMLVFTINNVDSWDNKSPYFQNVDTQQANNAFKRLLYHIEDLISQQTDFTQYSSNKFKMCVKEMFEGCVKVCVNKYNQPLDRCQNELCTSEKQENNSNLRCEEMLTAH
ncbi:hypothetical protein AB4187_15010 [Vibrio breoganii]